MTGPDNPSDCRSFTDVIQASLPFSQSGYFTVDLAAKMGLSVGIIAAIACGALVAVAGVAVWLIARRRCEQAEDRSALTEPITEVPRLYQRTGRWERI
jgi:hypothetical protein